MSAGLLEDWEQAQRRAERRRWSWSALAILLSGTAVAVGLQWQMFDNMTPLPPAAAMVIELMPLQAPPSPPSAQPEGEQQVEAPKPKPPIPKPRPKLELAKSEIALPDEPDPVQEEEEEVQEQAPAPETRAPPQVEAPPAHTASAPRQSAYSQAASAAKVTFEQRLLGHLERHKRYPRAAQLRRQQGMPYIRFTMDRNGQVLASRLERGTGHALLDEEALALLARAQPLPAMPSDMPGATMEIVVPIEFFLSNRR